MQGYQHFTCCTLLHRMSYLTVFWQTIISLQPLTHQGLCTRIRGFVLRKNSVIIVFSLRTFSHPVEVWLVFARQPPVGQGLLIHDVFDHTQRRATVGRTPLDEWSSRRRDLYLTTHNRQTLITSVGFEPTISVGERATDIRLRPCAQPDRHRVVAGFSKLRQSNTVFYAIL